MKNIKCFYVTKGKYFECIGGKPALPVPHQYVSYLWNMGRDKPFNLMFISQNPEDVRLALLENCNKTGLNCWYRITDKDGKVDAVVNVHESWLPYLWRQAVKYTYSLQEVPAKRALRLKKILDEKRRRTQGMCHYALPVWLDVTEPYLNKPKSEIEIYLLDSQRNVD